MLVLRGFNPACCPWQMSPWLPRPSGPPPLPLQGFQLAAPAAAAAAAGEAAGETLAVAGQLRARRPVLRHPAPALPVPGGLPLLLLLLPRLLLLLLVAGLPAGAAQPGRSPGPADSLE